MTLSIAALWPPDNIREINYAQLPFKLEKTIIFCTDSRISLAAGNHIRHKDIGNKIFSIVDGIGLVYAGNTEIVRKACILSQKAIKKDQVNSDLNKLLKVFRAAFKKSYVSYQHKHLRLDPRLLHTLILVGFRNMVTDDCKVFEFSSPNFEPIQKFGVSIIGSSDEVRSFYMKEFNTAVNKDIMKGYPTTATEWCLLLYVALTKTIESNIDSGVGGLGQMMILGKSGFNTLMAVTLNEFDESERLIVEQEGPGWVKKDGNGRIISRTNFPPYGPIQK